MKAAASFNSFSRRPVITTCAPSSTKRLAVAKPIPLLPPVTTAIFPANFCPLLLLIIFYPFVVSVLVVDMNSHVLDLRHAAIDGEIHAGDVRTFIGSKEHDDCRDFLGLASAAERNL